MRVTIVKSDGIVGVNGVFRSVILPAMPEGARIMQWDGDSGHIEYESNDVANQVIDSIGAIQSFIDLWNAAAPLAPTTEELIAAAHTRINLAYEASVNTLTEGYPSEEISSWPKQEAEARAWLADPTAETPWIDGAIAARGVSKETFVSLVISNADALAPIHGQLTGKRQYLRDQINALGVTVMPEQLDAITWESP